MNQRAVLALTVLASSIKPIREIHYSGLSQSFQQQYQLRMSNIISLQILSANKGIKQLKLENIGIGKNYWKNMTFYKLKKLNDFNYKLPIFPNLS